LFDMPDLIPATIAAYLALFAMMNPIGNTPVFLSVVGNTPASFRTRAAFITCFSILVILVGSIFGGTAILSAFGISMPAFEIAGGVIVLGIGLKMLHGGDNSTHQTPAGAETIADKEKEASSKLIVPLAMPIFGGPGSITTVVTVAAAHQGDGGYIGTALGTTLLVATMFLCFAGSSLLRKIITPQVEQILVRFMGLILSSIAVGMMLQGIAVGTTNFIKRESPAIESFLQRTLDDVQPHTPTDAVEEGESAPSSSGAK